MHTCRSRLGKEPGPLTSLFETCAPMGSPSTPTPYGGFDLLRTTVVLNSRCNVQKNLMQVPTGPETPAETRNRRRSMTDPRRGEAAQPRVATEPELRA